MRPPELPQGTTVCVHTRTDVEQLSDRNWDRVIGLCFPCHSDNESFFGPPNQPKLIVSKSLGHSVVFQVCRAPGDVPSSITLDRGDLFVMDRRINGPRLGDWSSFA